jgi:hypothetical protein
VVVGHNLMMVPKEWRQIISQTALVSWLPRRPLYQPDASVVCFDHHHPLVNSTLFKCHNKSPPRSSRVCVGHRSSLLLADPETLELQAQYSNYKETLQAIAQKIGDVETEAEEHKYVCLT